MMRRFSIAGWLTVFATSAAAQAPVARVSIGGGNATDLRGARSAAYLVSPSITLFPSTHLSLGASGRGIRFAGAGWSVGGAASAAATLPVGPHLNIRIGGIGDATYTSYRASYFQAEAMSAIEARLGNLSLWGGGRGAVARSVIEQPAPTPPVVPGTDRNTITQHSMLGPAWGAAWRLTSSTSGDGIRFTYREEHGRPGGKLVVDRAAGATVVRGAVLLSANTGFREASGENRTFGGGQMVITLSSGVAIFGSAEWYPSNRLTGAFGGRAFSAGIVLSTGGTHRPRALPRPAGVDSPAPGYTRLSIQAKGAATVEVAGDWNRWQQVPLQKSANGVWFGDFSIPPGIYRYAFRLDGRNWEVPKGVAAVNDGFGGKSAWLSVGESERGSEKSANSKEVP